MNEVYRVHHQRNVRVEQCLQGKRAENERGRRPDFAGLLTAIVDPFFPVPPLKMQPKYSVKNVYDWARNTDTTTAIFHPNPIIGNLFDKYVDWEYVYMEGRYRTYLKTNLTSQN